MNHVHLPMHQFRAVIFDMDGTMINNAAHHKRAWQLFLKQYDISLSEEEFSQKVSGKKNDQILRDLFGDTLSSQEIENYGESKEALYRELFKSDIAEINGLTNIIHQFHRLGLPVAIATTASAKNRAFALDELGLNGLFRTILGEEHVRRGKPNPEIYLQTAKQLEVPSSTCLVFEDSPAGVQAAKSAGMTVVGILSSHAAFELVGADYTVNDYSEIQLET